MDIVVGNIVTGEDLYGRKRELQLLWKTIEKDSLLLTSPRRYGKTSIVNDMKDNPRPGWSVTYIDMEGFADPYEFIIELLSHVNPPLLQKVKNLFRSARDATDTFQILDVIGVKLRESNSSWKKKGTEIFRELKKNNSKSIVIIDELPIYLLKMQEKYRDNGSTVSAFLHWLRSIRQNLQIRFIVCGSIGINSIVDGYGLENSVNDLSRLSLPPFDDETAKGMITTLLDKCSIDYTDDLIKEVMAQIGLQIPFFIQLMLKEIWNRTDFGKEKLTSEIISNSYRQGLLGTEGRKDFEWYFKRLKTEFKGKDYSIALEILKRLTQVSSATEAELEEIHNKIKRKENKPEFRKILDILETGFYVAKNGDGLAFHNKVLRDLWIQKGGVR